MTALFHEIFFLMMKLIECFTEYLSDMIDGIYYALYVLWIFLQYIYIFIYIYVHNYYMSLHQGLCLYVYIIDIILCVYLYIYESGIC